MPEALQVSFNVDVYLTWLFPLIFAEEGDTKEEQYTKYNKYNIKSTYTSRKMINLNDFCHYDMSCYMYISSLTKLTCFLKLLLPNKGHRSLINMQAFPQKCPFYGF